MSLDTGSMDRSICPVDSISYLSSRKLIDDLRRWPGSDVFPRKGRGAPRDRGNRPVALLDALLNPDPIKSGVKPGELRLIPSESSATPGTISNAQKFLS